MQFRGKKPSVTRRVAGIWAPLLWGWHITDDVTRVRRQLWSCSWSFCPWCFWLFLTSVGKIVFFNEEEGRSKVRLHLLKLGSSSCNLCLWCDALVWKSISGESACSGSAFLVVPCFALPCNWKKIGWYNFLPSQENTLKLEPNFRDFGDSFRPKLFGVQRTVWLDIDILSSPSSGCV